MRDIVKVVKAYEEAINQNRIIGSVCNSCGEIAVPPRPICRKCGSSDIDFTTVEGKGKLLTWTVINIAPPTHTDKAPYILGIVELTNGERLTGIIDADEGTELKHLMEMTADFDPSEEGAKRLRWKIA